MIIQHSVITKSGNQSYERCPYYSMCGVPIQHYQYLFIDAQIGRR